MRTSPHRLKTRRKFLLAAAGGAGLLAVGCGGAGPTTRGAAASAADGFESPAPGSTPEPRSTAAPTVAPTPTPAPRPAGTSQRLLLAGNRSETPAFIEHSGLAGPAVLVLGGVHGNEPGGWLAAEQVATWHPKSGGLLVVPRANTLAIAEFVRTTDDLGDLNRLYPGSPTGSRPMERMAAEIVALAAEFEVDLVLDMHESWGFYAERTQNGTAFLGQTLTTGIGPRNPALGQAIIAGVNAAITGRDRLIERDGSAFRRDPTLGDPSATPGNRGRSSLSLGGHIPRLTPLLVEMGQERQAIERRVELHLLVARKALDQLGM